MESQLEKKWVETEAGRIYYFAGQSFAGRPTAVFLHGLSANHTTWLGVARRLADEKIDSLLVELRGHGYSDKTRQRKFYQLPVFSEDLAAIIGQERLTEFILVGYSFGGAIALDYVISRRPKPAALCLISTNHVNPLKYWGIGFLTLPGRLLLNLLAFLLVWQKRKNYYYYEPLKAKSYWRSVKQGFGTMPWSINLWMLEQMGLLDFNCELEKIKIPTLIMYSRHDPFLTKAEVAQLAEKLPQAEFKVSGNESHFVASKAQEEVAQAIIDFIKRF